MADKKKDSTKTSKCKDDSSCISKKNLYYQVYLSHVTNTINHCKSIKKLTHGGEKGRIREILLRSLFRPLLPLDLGVGTGFVIGAGGSISSQRDIILYDRATLPPALFDCETGFFPIESVLFVIEVKSCLNHKELLSAHNAAKELSLIKMHAIKGQEISHPASAVFALSSDLKRGGDESKRYDDIRGQDRRFLSSICVSRRGYWYTEQDGSFPIWPERTDDFETVAFLAGIIRALPDMYAKRRSSRPPIGYYLIDFGNDLSQLTERFAAFEKEALQHCTEKNLDILRKDLEILSSYKTDSQDCLKSYRLDLSTVVQGLHKVLTSGFISLEQKIDSAIAELSGPHRETAGGISHD